MDPLFYPRRWEQQRGEAMSTFLRRLLDEGLERYLQAFDDEPSDGSDTAGLDELQRLAEKAKRDHEEGRTARLEPLANNDADDARTAQLLHDGTTVEADPDKTLTVDVDFRDEFRRKRAEWSEREEL